MKKYIHHIFLLFSLVGMSVNGLFAQTAAADTVKLTPSQAFLQNFPQTPNEQFTWFLFGIIYLLLALCFIGAFGLFYVLKADIDKRNADLGYVAGEQGAQESWWQKFRQAMEDAVPIEKEKDIEFHHSYDGIRELDNNLPPWWKYGFYLTIVFAFIYMFYFHLSGKGLLQDAEYKEAIKIGNMEKQAYMEKAANSINETNVTQLTDAAGIAEGKKIFLSKCAVCHKPDGGGAVGPNLTDKFWLHGGDIKNVFATIKNGVPEKGMISWKGELRPPEIQQVASFIKSLKGTTPVEPKEPQGIEETE